jgi:ABC-type uncharacterized transport system ATPase subunit
VPLTACLLFFFQLINELSLTDAEMKALEELNDNDELAAPPSGEEVFGKQLEEFKEEYKEDVDRMNHQLEENKVRQTHHLAAKLAARRQRRARKTVEEEETKAADVGGRKSEE